MAHQTLRSTVFARLRWYCEISYKSPAKTGIPFPFPFSLGSDYDSSPTPTTARAHAATPPGGGGPKPCLYPLLNYRTTGGASVASIYRLVLRTARWVERAENRPP